MLPPVLSVASLERHRRYTRSSKVSSGCNGAHFTVFGCVPGFRSSGRFCKGVVLTKGEAMRAVPCPSKCIYIHTHIEDQRNRNGTREKPTMTEPPFFSTE